jgi:hypothetical protein
MLVRPLGWLVEGVALGRQILFDLVLLPVSKRHPHGRDDRPAQQQYPVLIFFLQFFLHENKYQGKVDLYRSPVTQVACTWVRP